MKKVILSTGFGIALSIAIHSTNFVHSNPNGAPAGNTGAPKTTGTETTCARSGCHGSILNAGPHSINLTIAGDPTSFDPGSTYTLTSTIVSGTGNAAGFQIVCLNPSKVSTGTWTAGTGSKATSLSGRSYLTHSSSNRKTWTYTWKAPAEASAPDSVTFYFAGMETVSGTYRTYTGKKVFHKTVVTANESLTTPGDFTLYPVPATRFLNLSTGGFSSITSVEIFDLEGKSVLKTSVLPGVQYGEIQLPATMKPGVYVARIQNSEGKAARRFIKE